ncbi:MAG: TRAP transporter large permease [candidate division NC10 bacterium]|nr:TRAP transporter large permease [candidate division NC10 bacterium]
MVLIGALFLALLAIGVPIIFVLGISGLVYVYLADLSLVLIPQRLFVGLNSFLVLSVPLFILAGNIMNASGITERIVRFSNLLIGRVRGGLAYVTVVATMFFAGITGAGAADTSAIGSIMIPAMRDQGYKAEYAAAITAAGAIVGPIIPPSIAFVIYGAMADVSIAGLFMAGFLPGILSSILMGAVVWRHARVHNFPVREATVSLREYPLGFVEALPGLMMPAIILGGILGGVFTPTEAAAAGVLYALLVGFLVYRELKPASLWFILRDTAIMSGGVMLIVANASLFSWILAAEQVPQEVANLITGLSREPWVVLLLINLLLLFVGCIMETLAAIIILTPVLLPLVKGLGIDPLHFGVIIVVNLSIGLSTPPVGVNLFVAGGIARVSLEQISRAIWPFVLATLIALAITTYWPGMVLLIPRLFLK